MGLGVVLLFLILSLSHSNALEFCKGIDGFNSTFLDFSNWDLFLKNFNQFSVNITDDRYFQLFGCQLENAKLTDFDIEQWYAFWINAYNYMSVYVVVHNPCIRDLFDECGYVTSVVEIATEQPALPLFLPRVWTQKFVKIAGERVSLNDIVNYLRKPKDIKGALLDPTFYLCLAPSSVSGPELLNEAYKPETLADQMKGSAEAFFTGANGIAADENSLYLSAIFAWNWVDFENETLYEVEHIQSAYPSLKDFLMEYAPINYYPKIKTIKTHDDFNIIRYNWSLNKNITGAHCHERMCFPLWSLILITLALITVTMFIAICTVGCRTKITYEQH